MNDEQWHDAVKEPVPEIVGMPVEIEYSDVGGVRTLKGHSGPPFGIYSADLTVPYEDILRWRYA